MSPLDDAAAAPEADQEQRQEVNLADLADWIYRLQDTLKGIDLMLLGMHRGNRLIDDPVYHAVDYSVTHARDITERVLAILEHREERWIVRLPDNP